MVVISLLETKQNLGPAVCASLETTVGWFYELDHSKLPPKAPGLLKSIRIVMVSKKALLKVWVRFPSLHSLKSFLSNNVSVNNQLPELDEEYLLELETASEILYRRILPEEIYDRSKDWSFWAVIRQRRYETMNEARDEEKESERCGALGDEEEGEETEEPNVVHNWSQKGRVVIASVERWCPGRYEMAEDNMQKVLETRGATAGNPIQRPTLRNEPRKLMSDMGLLYHLLKPLAGKMAPDGTDRFQTRHNADGGLEYWLESADLVEIKEAGVQHPYWTPPQGWKLGDDPSQDLIFASRLKELWDEMTKMKKREKESKQPEQGLAMVPTTSQSLVTSLDWDQAYSLVMQLKEEIMELKATMQTPAAALIYYSEAADVPELTGSERRADENMATQLERLRSGFQICRPQGTFLWPNTNFSMSPHQTDPSGLPTTPWVTTSTKPVDQLDLVLTLSPHAPSGPSPASSSACLVKPFAERRTVSTSNLLSSGTLSPALTQVPSIQNLLQFLRP